MLNFMQVNYILHGFCAPQNCPLPAVKRATKSQTGEGDLYARDVILLELHSIHITPSCAVRPPFISIMECSSTMGDFAYSGNFNAVGCVRERVRDEREFTW